MVTTYNKTTYQWGNTFGVFDASVDAQAVGERIESLRAELGDGLTPLNVVDDARPESAPTHELFNWDDSDAAELFRQHQARHILKAIRIVITPIDESQEPKDTRVVISNVSAFKGGIRAYYPTSVVVNDVDLRESALKDLRVFLLGFANKYQSLSDVSDPILERIFNLVEELKNNG